jgi:3-methylfumaryl-CoA hydratase
MHEDTAPPDLRDWIGRSEDTDGRIDAAPAQALSATLDREDDTWRDGDALPPLWHWLYLLPRYPTRAAGDDGHARRGGFLPPVPLPRRMWAGGDLHFDAPLRIGQSLRRRSTVIDVTRKQGRSGALAFVRVRHEFFADGAAAAALTEHHDIVYRAAPAPDEAAPPGQPAPAARFVQTVTPGPLLLFRYSALTFNGHRIHYDRDYCRRVEGYPGLVVHAPLQATLMAGLLRDHARGTRLRRLAFRAVRPLFDTAPCTACGALDDDGRGARLWMRDAEGWLTMTAEATLDPA